MGLASGTGCCGEVHRLTAPPCPEAGRELVLQHGLEEWLLSDESSTDAAQQGAQHVFKARWIQLDPFFFLGL
jgi:hypothetical protein